MPSGARTLPSTLPPACFDEGLGVALQRVAERIVGGDEEPGVAARLGQRAADALGQHVGVVGELEAPGRALLADEVGRCGLVDQVDASSSRARSAAPPGPRRWRSRRPGHRRRCRRSTARAIAEAMSGLFCSSACRISIGRPSTEPPKSCTASSAACLLPGPPLARYGPFMSLSRPILTDVEADCARRIAGLASGSVAKRAKRGATREAVHLGRLPVGGIVLPPPTAQSARSGRANKAARPHRRARRGADMRSGQRGTARRLRRSLPPRSRNGTPDRRGQRRTAAWRRAASGRRRTRCARRGRPAASRRSVRKEVTLTTLVRRHAVARRARRADWRRPGRSAPRGRPGRCRRRARPTWPDITRRRAGAVTRTPWV